MEFKMEFGSPILTRGCTRINAAIREDLKQRALELDELRNQRNDEFIQYITEYFGCLQMESEAQKEEENIEKKRQNIEKKRQAVMVTTDRLKEKSTTLERDLFKEHSMGRCCAYTLFHQSELPKLQTNNLSVSKREIQFSVDTLKKQFLNFSQTVFAFPPFLEHETSNTKKVKVLSEGARGYPTDYSEEILKTLHSHEAQKNIETIQQRRKGEKAVSIVVEAFKKAGRSEGLLMFILSNFKYQHYLSSAENKTGTVTKVKGDHDVLIICKQIGVIFVQVKGCCEDTSKKSIHDAIHIAFSQLIYDKMVFLESNRDLNFIRLPFPTWEFVAVPFLGEKKLAELHLCSEHKTLVLGKENLDVNMLNQVTINKNIPFTKAVDEFYSLCARYVNLSGPVQSLPKGIKEASHSFKKLILTPKQQEILRSKNVFQIIRGDFGTGKTLLLCFKAVESLKDYNDSRVVFVICSEVDKYSNLHIKSGDSPILSFIQHFMRKRNERFETSKVEIFTLCNLYQKLPKKKNENRVPMTVELFCHLIKMTMTQNINLFIDEMPLQLFEKCKYELSKLAKNEKANVVWIAIATQSSYRNVTPQSSTSDSHSETFHCADLKYNMRNSQSILKLMKYISEYTKEKYETKTDSGTAVEGPIPLLFRIEKCFCPSVPSKEQGIFCPCLKGRIVRTLKYVLSKLSIPVDDTEQIVYVVQHIYNDGFESSILKNLISTFKKVFQSLGLEQSKFQWLTFANKSEQHYSLPYNPEAIHIVDWATFIGCESTVVVNFDFFSMRQWLPNIEVGNGSVMVLSRCTTQYVHIVLQGNEPQTFIEQHIDMFRSYISNHKTEDCPNPSHKESLQNLETFTNCMEEFIQNKKDLLEELLKEGLLLEEDVSRTKDRSKSDVNLGHHLAGTDVK